MERWTIRRVLAWTAEDFAARGVGTARLDAELLVAHALGLDRVRLYMDLDRPLADAERETIRDLVKRRRAREPVAYILGRKDFYGRTFRVSPAVLIPRPDTETLIERALALLPADAAGPVADLCTGSGAIGLTLAAERSGSRAVLTDVSADALAIARANAQELGVIDRVELALGDLFAALDASARFALIACNPPYVPEEERGDLMPDVRDHEPHLALFAPERGLAFHRRLAEGAARFLAQGGPLLIEVGAGQAPEVGRMLAERGWRDVRAHRDLGGHERVVEARAG